MGVCFSTSSELQRIHKNKLNNEVDEYGFPLDGSIKSLSLDGSYFGESGRNCRNNGDSEVDEHGFPRDHSIKSVSLFAYSARQQDTQLESQVKKQAKEIAELKTRNKTLQNEILQLRKTIDQLTLQASVTHPFTADISKPTIKKNLHAEKIRVDTGDGVERNLPMVGDHVVAMWGQSKWQYFTATIESFDKKELKYVIEWDDHDPTGREIDYYNLAIDRVPSTDQIGIGSKVLFHQGQYKQQEVHGVTRSGGLRWHQGEIEQIYENAHGVKLYDGRHTKGQEDGKWVTFKDYSQSFVGYTVEDFRLPPNVFDILSSTQSEDEDNSDGLDVFLSYAKINCPSAISGKEITEDLPPSYQEAVLKDMCDPREIAKRLQSMGIRVFTMENDGGSSLLEIAAAMKRAKVFVACLSDEYASNDKCRMEFQFAKKTLKLPVIPIVVGAGSFEWQMTVVGLLIAGELYIHFKNKTVEGFKMTELVRTIQHKIPDLKIENVQHPATGQAYMPLYNSLGVGITGKPVVSSTADFFFSYSWLNSFDAFTKSQVSKFVGEEWNDPRLIARHVSKNLHMQSWLDIERLESAADGMGMFGQIATAMKECKFVVACISSEYAASDNCRMEFQFARMSLKKPVLALVVGKGNVWLETAVGKSVQEGLYVDFQTVSSDSDMEKKLNEIKSILSQLISLDETIVSPMKTEESEEVETKPTFRAPVIGDHVICLHQRWAYFMATVDKFDPDTMNYTVTWDDNDSSGRVQSYQDVALDVTPTEQVGVDSIVLFAQGSYGGTEGNNIGGSRYHRGKITKVYEDENKITRFDGEHTKGEPDGKWITYQGYGPKFTQKTIEEIRVSPNAMDALMACRETFNVAE